MGILSDGSIHARVRALLRRDRNRSDRRRSTSMSACSIDLAEERLQRPGASHAAVMKIADCGDAHGVLDRGHIPPDEEGARCIPEVANGVGAIFETCAPICSICLSSAAMASSSIRRCAGATARLRSSPACVRVSSSARRRCFRKLALRRHIGCPRGGRSTGGLFLLGFNGLRFKSSRHTIVSGACGLLDDEPMERAIRRNPIMELYECRFV